MTKTLRKIYPLFKCIIINDPINSVEAIETSRGKVGEIVGLSAPMNRIDLSTYLSNEKESLIVSDTEI